MDVRNELKDESKDGYGLENIGIWSPSSHFDPW